MSGKVWLWHDECPQGAQHCKSKQSQLLEQGWKDSPILVKQPEPKAEVAVSIPEPKGATIEEVIEIVKAAGFVVKTPVEYEADVNKKANSISEEALAEAIVQAQDEQNAPENLAPSSEESGDDKTDIDEALQSFKDSPALLDDDEVLQLAKDLKLEVRSNMKRETLEAKITEHLG